MDQATTHDWNSLYTRWVEWLIHMGRLPNTRKLYTRIVQEAHADLGNLPQAQSEDLDQWILDKGGRPSTVGNRIAALTSFFRFMVKHKHRPDNPAAELDRPTRRKGVPKPIADLEAALVILDTWDAKVEGRRVGQTRDMAVFLYQTGLRIHEAVGCTWPVPCPEEVTIIGKGAKEAIMLPTATAREAWDRLGGHWPIGARATQRRFERAGFHPHQLRHTLATTLVRKGVEIGTVSKLMRHSSVATTMIYAQYDTDRLRNALSKVG